MNKTIKFDMDDEFILISINEGEPYKISTKERILSAEEIYNLLDYSIGDKYSYEEIKIEGKDGVVINKIKDLFKTITDKAENISVSENDKDLKEKIKMLEEDATFSDQNYIKKKMEIWFIVATIASEEIVKFRLENFEISIAINIYFDILIQEKKELNNYSTIQSLF